METTASEIYVSLCHINEFLMEQAWYVHKSSSKESGKT